MTIHELYEQLEHYLTGEHYRGEVEVLAFNADSQKLENITGLLFDPESETLEICTDDNS